MNRHHMLYRKRVFLLLLTTITLIVGWILFVAQPFSPDANAAADEQQLFFSATTDQPVSSSGPLSEQLPELLRDTEVDGVLATDGVGELIIDIGLRRRFDYFLSAQGDSDIAEVRALLAASLAAELRSDDVQRALAIFDRYVGLQSAMHRMAPHDGTLAGLRAAVEERNSLRAAWLGQQVAEAFFGFDDRYDAFVLERARVLADDDLTAEQQQAQIKALRDTLPPAMRELIEAPHRPVRLAAQVAALRQQGAPEQQVQRLRADTVGREAAARLAALDAERAAWQQRYQAYRAERARIEQSGLAPADRQLAIERLREQQFNELERRRVSAQDALLQSGVTLP